MASKSKATSTMKLKNLIRVGTLAACLGALSPSAFASDEFSLESARELYKSGAWETAREAFEDAYKAAPEKSVTKAEAALELATLLWEQGEYGAAEARIKDAVSRVKALKLEETLGRVLLTQGHIEASLGKLRQAESTLKVCSKSAEDYKDIYTAALCRIQLQFVLRLRGFPMNEAQYQKDLALLRNSDRDLMIGTALAKGSDAFLRTGDQAQALDLLNQAQARYVAAKSAPAQARNRLRRAQVLQDMGRWAEAANDLKGLEREFLEMKNRPSLVTYYALAGRQADHQGNQGEALNRLNQSKKLAEQVKSPQMVANTQLALCEHHAKHKTPHAVGACADAQQRFKAVGIPDLAARAQVIHARMLHTDGQLVQARTAYLDSAKELEKRVFSDSDRRNVANIYANLCQIELQVKSKGALTACREALKKLNEVKSPNAEVETLIAASHHSAGAGAYNLNLASEAKEHFEKAIVLFEKHKDDARAADAYLRLGRLQARTKDKAAFASFQRVMELTAQKPALSQTRIQGYIQLSQWLMDQENWTGAGEQLDAMIREGKDAEDLAWGHHARARVSLKLKERTSAVEHLKKGLEHAKKTEDKELIRSIESSLKKFDEGN